MLSRRTFMWLAGTFLATRPALGQVPSNDLPREQLLILENPEGTIKNAGWFNIWAINAGGQSTGLHQNVMDTFWYIDPDHGIDGVWDNSLATEKPIYNKNFTEMTVKLRSGVFWSDGIEFTADDVVFTIETHMKTSGLRWSAPVQINVAAIEKKSSTEVLFKLKKPNSRFHALFTVRWNAMWMMPKHVFEKVGDVLKFDFNPPVGLGAYTLHNFDRGGKWFIWKKREDWNRTSVARFGEPGPGYLAYIDPGPPEKRVIEQLNHRLDVIHDLSPEGMFTLAKDSPSSVSWFKGFPYAHPDPTLPSVIFNNRLEKFQNKDVRWALALLIDIKAVSMASYRGAATISAIGVPPTGLYPKYYFEPMEQWLTGFELDTGKRKIKPYDPTIGKQIAEMLRPSLKDQIPTDPADIATAFGRGWWKPDPEAATELLQKAGFTKQGDRWFQPNGQPFSVKVMVEGDLRPVMTRAGSIIAQQWRRFGIDANIDVAQGTMLDRRGVGDFDTFIGWSVETWGGHPDLSFFLDSWHSQFVVDVGKVQPPRNWQRWKEPRLDKIIEEIRTIDFDDPRGVELGLDYLKLAAEEMPIIPLMAYNVFATMDTTYWTGFPSLATKPYTNPVSNWGNTKYMMVNLKPTKPAK
ncbi:ABC transporter substrate-binding protein [Neorhizobium galegae]|uniref:Extracellular solute-binding protein family 5 n=1 Tax=Neorhizobium galegae bv. officinalis TaxID=323656 RepID=A0A0T7H4D2_NEOGA|nr:ABC transporter substrate-binding protein [Neorhizobium galegae]CDZ54358.1 Extracellular solute-binding protein family 5 [Neorhizobium galegae bv. officinalis]